MRSVVRYLSDEFLHRKGGTLPGPWRLSPSDACEMPQQDNGCDCGVFACVAAEFLQREVSMGFHQTDMPQCRRWIEGCLRREAAPVCGAISRTRRGFPSSSPEVQLVSCPIQGCPAFFHIACAARHCVARHSGVIAASPRVGVTCQSHCVLCVSTTCPVAPSLTNGVGGSGDSGGSGGAGGAGGGAGAGAGGGAGGRGGGAGSGAGAGAGNVSGATSTGTTSTGTTSDRCTETGLQQKQKHRLTRLLRAFNKGWAEGKLRMRNDSAFWHPLCCGACKDHEGEFWGACGHGEDHREIALQTDYIAGGLQRFKRYSMSPPLCICNDCVAGGCTHKFPCNPWIERRDTSDGQHEAALWARTLTNMQQPAEEKTVEQQPVPGTTSKQRQSQGSSDKPSFMERLRRDRANMNRAEKEAKLPSTHTGQGW